MSTIIVTVGTPPRGSGQQPAKTIQAQSMRGSIAWGGSPSTATLIYPGSAIGTGISAGSLVTINLGSMQFCDQLLEREGLALVPGGAFGDDRCVRLSCAVSSATIDDGLARLGRFLGSIPSFWGGASPP